MNFLDDMRERPEEERLAFAMIAAIVVALVLFAVWGAVFFTSERNVARVDVRGQSASVAESFQEARSNFGEVSSEFSAQYIKIQKALEVDGYVESEPQGKNTVELSVDSEGEVQATPTVEPE